MEEKKKKKKKKKEQLVIGGGKYGRKKQVYAGIDRETMENGLK